MSYTEEDAAERYCVQSMHMEDPLMCEGSKCMGWVWLESEIDREKGETINVKGGCGIITAVSLDSLR